MGVCELAESSAIAELDVVGTQSAKFRTATERSASGRRGSVVRTRHGARDDVVLDRRRPRRALRRREEVPGVGDERKIGGGNDTARRPLFVGNPMDNGPVQRRRRVERGILVVSLGRDGRCRARRERRDEYEQCGDNAARGSQTSQVHDYRCGAQKRYPFRAAEFHAGSHGAEALTGLVERPR
jgi:hypothetical protein